MFQSLLVLFVLLFLSDCMIDMLAISRNLGAHDTLVHFRNVIILPFTINRVY